MTKDCVGGGHGEFITAGEHWQWRLLTLASVLGMYVLSRIPTAGAVAGTQP